jgi:murein DD-endopeptidase MepM/ murein hydrolase activator NlpD
MGSVGFVEWLGSGLILACAVPALADDAAEPPATPSVHITVGRGADLEGRPAYAQRSNVATAAEVSLTYTPPPQAGVIPARMPLAKDRLTSRFGMRVDPVTGIYGPHSGIDLAAPVGTPIHATADGVVGAASWFGGYGLMVVIESGGGLETRFAHMSRVAVTPGERVHAGDVLGYVGSTGTSTGPHLHYETRLKGHPVDPLDN